MAQRFGLPAPAVIQRLSAGRVRVKTGLPEERARQLADQLRQMGAAVSVHDSATGAPLPSARPSAPRPVAPAPPVSASLGVPPLEFEDVDDDEQEITDVAGAGTLYAQGQDAGPALELDRHGAHGAGFGGTPIAAAPPPPRPTAGAAHAPPATPPPHSAPHSAPPLALSPSSPVPPLSAPAGAPAPGFAPRRITSPSTPATPRPPPGAAGLELVFWGRPKTRILVGLALAALIGLLGSWIYVGAVKDKGYRAIVADVESYQANTLSLSQWTDELPKVRSEAVARMERARTQTLVVSLIIWGVLSAGAALAWFRVLT